MKKSRIRIIFVMLFLFSLSCKKGEIPILNTSPIESIAGTSARSGGEIIDEGSSTVIRRGVCWSTDEKPTIDDNKTIDGAGAGIFTSKIEGLKGATVYFVRAYAINEVGTGYGMAYSFKTMGQLPNPTITYATSNNPSIVTFRGTVNPNYLLTTVTFEYGETTSYGNFVPATQSPINGNTNTTVTAVVAGFLPATRYHYRIVAVNSLGTTYSNDMGFTTLGQVPTVITLPATNTGLIEAQLNGTVNANYLSTKVSFEYGTDLNYGNIINAAQSPVTGNENTSVNAKIFGVIENTTYHYRIVAENSLGKTYGSDMTFITKYQIGGNVNGGILFYLDETGKHGLVCAPTDQSTGTEWGCYLTNLPGAGGLDIGTGNQNTIDIVNGCSTAGIAAKICYDLDLNGYNDWFLPSREELRLMYTNLKAKGLGGFANNYYWSSSEAAHDDAWALDFSRNYMFVPNKFKTYRVRAVRAF